MWHATKLESRVTKWEYATGTQPRTYCTGSNHLVGKGKDEHRIIGRTCTTDENQHAVYQSWLEFKTTLKAAAHPTARLHKKHAWHKVFHFWRFAGGSCKLASAGRLRTCKQTQPSHNSITSVWRNRGEWKHRLKNQRASKLLILSSDDSIQPWPSQIHLGYNIKKPSSCRTGFPLKFQI